MIVHMVGNSHIDPVWLWRWEAGVDEAIATFSSAVQRCDEYPEFIYTRGEAWLYQQVESIAPDLFARVRELVAAGRWHITGGQYIQPDANGPTEAGWRQQILHGQRYFADRFGVQPTVGYNVDSFGHSATIPDMLVPLGYRGYAFHRPEHGQMDLPAQTFRWRGPAGAELIGIHITPAYLSHVGNLYSQIMIAAKAADPALGHAICFYGVGNHGGAPTKTNIEYILSHIHAFDGIELRFSTPEAFVDAVSGRRDLLPVVTEELQHVFPGCYSLMHDIKQRQRHGERLLDQCARAIDGLVDDAAERGVLEEKLDTAWSDLLFTQFHDILAGTAIPSAWSSVRAMQGRAQIGAEEIITDVTRRWARRNLPKVNQQQLVFFNPDPAPWKGLLEVEPFLDFDHWGNRWVSDLEGHRIRYQEIQPEAQQLMCRFLVPAQIGAASWTHFLVRDDESPAADPVATDLEVSTTHMANSRIQLDLDGHGVHSLVADGVQILGNDGIRLMLRDDYSNSWGVDTADGGDWLEGSDHFTGRVATEFVTDGWVVEEAGPLRARLRAEGLLAGSPIRWTLTLHTQDPRLHVRLETVFCEHHRLLQMPIDLGNAPTGWTAGMPAGSVQRLPAATEWPVQGWSAVQLAGQALAIITDDAYSASLEGALWQWTLLRSPKMAWGGGESLVYAGRDWYADQGEHQFDFTLQLSSDIHIPDLVQASRQHAEPPIVFNRYEGMNRPSYSDNPPNHVLNPYERNLGADGKPKPADKNK
jgi:alpha-mannosidase